MTGCVYAPKDDHSTHYHSPNDNTKQEAPKKKKLTDEDYVQQYVQNNESSNDAPFYNNGFDRVVPYNSVRPNPHYTPTPHPVNRTIYFIESRY